MAKTKKIAGKGKAEYNSYANKCRLQQSFKQLSFKLMLFAAILVFLLYPISSYAYDYSLEITEAQLPFSLEHNFSILSSSSQQINVSYGSFLSGPESFNISNSSSYTLLFNVSIGNSASVGNYTEYINLSNGNSFSIFISLQPENPSFGLKADKSSYFINSTAYITLSAPNGSTASIRVSSPEGTSSYEANITDGSVIAIALQKTGDYDVTADYSYKSYSEQLSTSFSVYDVLQCSISVPESAEISDTAKISALVSGGLGNYSYSWKIGNITSTQKEPSVKFSREGHYPVSLIVKDSSGLSAVCNAVLDIVVPSYSYIVNVKDKASNKRLGDAIVVIGKYAKKTNKNGKAIFDSIENGSYSIEISRKGYSDYSSDINITKDSSITVSLTRLQDDKSIKPKITIEGPEDNKQLTASSDIAATEVSFKVSSKLKLSYCRLFTRHSRMSGYKLQDSLNQKQLASNSSLKLGMLFSYSGDYFWFLECANKDSYAKTKERRITVSGLKSISDAAKGGAPKSHGKADNKTGGSDKSKGENQEKGKNELSGKSQDSNAKKDVSGDNKSIEDKNIKDVNSLIIKIDDSISKLSKPKQEGIEKAVSILGVSKKLSEAKQKALKIRKSLLNIRSLAIAEKDKKAKINELLKELNELKEKTPISLSLVDSFEITKKTAPEDAESNSLLAENATEYYSRKHPELKGFKRSAYLKKISELSGISSITSKAYVVKLAYASNKTKQATIVTKRILLKENKTGVMLYEYIPKQLAKTASELSFGEDYEIVDSDPVIRFFVSSLGETEISYSFEKKLSGQELSKIGSVLLLDLSYPENQLTGFMALAVSEGNIAFAIIMLLVVSSLGYLFVFRNSDLVKNGAIKGYGYLIKAFSENLKNGWISSAFSSRKKLIAELNNAAELVKQGNMHEALSSYYVIADLYQKQPAETKEQLHEILQFLKNEMDYFCFNRLMDSCLSCLNSVDIERFHSCCTDAEDIYEAMPESYKLRAKPRLQHITDLFEIRKAKADSEKRELSREQSIDTELFSREHG